MKHLEKTNKKITADQAYCTLRTILQSAVPISSRLFKLKTRFFSFIMFRSGKTDSNIFSPPPPKRPDLEKPSSVKARCGAGVVHADLESPVGEVRLWLQWGGDGLGVDVLGAIRTLQAGSGVAEVGGRPVVRGLAWLRRLLGVLHAWLAEVLGWGVVNRLTLLLLLVGLLTLLLVGFFDITVMCTGKRRDKELHCWLVTRVNAASWVCGSLYSIVSYQCETLEKHLTVLSHFNEPCSAFTCSAGTQVFTWAKGQIHTGVVSLNMGSGSPTCSLWAAAVGVAT